MYGDDILTGKTVANAEIMIYGTKANDYGRRIVIICEVAVV